MPEYLSQDQQALDWLTTANPNDQRAITAKQKLGIDDNDIKAYSWTKENAGDPKSVIAKNKLFDKIANATPGENVQGVKINERLAIKNLIDNEPDVQVEYLKRKGYDTRVIDGEVEAKLPGDINFKQIDPKGFDLWDATDILSDIGQAVVSTLAGGAAGVAAIPAGPVASVAAGTVAAGGAGMLYEGMKQDVANIAGVREGYSGDTMPRAFIENAGGELGGRLISGAFKALSSGAKGVANYFGIAKKEAAPAIEAAAKEIGAKPTAGMLLDSPMVQTSESSLYQAKGTVGGMGLRKTIEANKKAALDTAKIIVQDASSKSRSEVGHATADKVIEEVSKRLQPAIEIYEKYEGALSFARPAKSDIAAIFQKVRSGYAMEEGAQTALKGFEKTAAGKGGGGVAADTLAGLKSLRTAVGNAKKEATNPGTERALGELYGELTALRSSTLLKYAKGNGQAFYEAASKEIPMADSIYRDVMTDIPTLMGKKTGARTGKKVLIEFMQDANKEKLVNDILKTGNPEKVEFFAKKYPEVFKELRAGSLADIAERSMEKGELSPAKLVKILQGLPPESRAMILGQGNTTKFEALKTYLDNIPKMSGPSGTPAGLMNSKMWNLMNQGQAIWNSIKYDFASNPTLGKDSLTKLSNFFANSKVKSAIQFGVEQRTDTPKLYLPGQTQPSFNQPVFMPRAQ